MEIKLNPIGWVRSPVASPAKGVNWGEVVSTVEIDPQWQEGLEGIEGFSHIIVIFWFHLTRDRTVLKVHPMKRPDKPLVGVFATRSPKRPNPIGITVVRLLRRKGNLLEVQGLDAYDGTPVLDIKPYIAPGDEAIGARTPDWIEKD